MGAMTYQITSLTIVYSAVYSSTDQRNIKALRHWPLWGEFTGDRWIPRTKSQGRVKCFHLMTSSCNNRARTHMTYNIGVLVYTSKELPLERVMVFSSGEFRYGDITLVETGIQKQLHPRTICWLCWLQSVTCGYTKVSINKARFYDWLLNHHH